MKRVAAEARASDRQQTAKRMRGQKEPFWTDSIKPEYVVEDGFRRVKPYYFEYRTFAKERWLGRTVLEVFQREFRDRSPEYYVPSAIVYGHFDFACRRRL
jgi:tRNA pseudouridine synthase 9